MQKPPSNIPKEPGTYLFFNAENEIIYIGKAKNLRNRVSSYWSNRSRLEPAKQQMLSEIRRVEWIAVSNEKEALLLEAGLIQKHHPKYNIDLKDDKSWMYIVITGEAFPRILAVRGTKKLRGEYFGPYTRAGTAKTIVRLLHQIMPLRTCTRDLSRLPNGLVCMQYHLGRCEGPCEKKITGGSYAGYITYARQILRGKSDTLLNRLRTEMTASSRKQEYEKAGVQRDRIRALETLLERQVIVHPNLVNQDIVGYAGDAKRSVVTIMQLRNGTLLDTFHFPLKNILSGTREEVLEQFLAQYYSRPQSKPRQIILPFAVPRPAERAVEPARAVYPKRGTQKKMLFLANKNAWLQYHKLTASKPLPPAVYLVKDILGLSKLPRRIEAYDISNIGGQYAVGAMVVVHDGLLAPAHYRKFKIRTVRRSNDVAMMKEILERRQRHAEWPAPDLILLDGGKPQLNTVYPILKEEWKERVAALAKREEELFVPGRRMSIAVPKNNQGLLLLMRARDAVHRQAIKYYRATHRKEV
ncbi:MAG: excinuclease ABC subunit UvrC [Patescibacteria group bacterium]